MYKKIIFPLGTFLELEKIRNNVPIGLPFITTSRLVNLDEITVGEIKNGHSVDTLNPEIVSVELKKWEIHMSQLTTNVGARLLKEKGNVMTLKPKILLLSGKELIDTQESAYLPGIIATLHMMGLAGLLTLDNKGGPHFMKAVHKLISTHRDNEGVWNMRSLEHLICSYDILLKQFGKCTIEDMTPEFSGHHTDDLTDYEKGLIQMTHACPDCGSLFLPVTDMSHNFYCSECKAGFAISHPNMYERLTSRTVPMPDGMLLCTEHK